MPKEIIHTTLGNINLQILAASSQKMFELKSVTGASSFSLRFLIILNKYKTIKEGYHVYCGIRTKVQNH
jgi:hypothetical protein